MRYSLIILLTFLMGCSSSGQYLADDRAELPAAFGDHWYQGKAEITVFDLRQARYGDMHRGEAVQIFVTEDFSRSKQLKLDHPSRNPEDAEKVLKLNMMRKFNTGIYPYSTMLSVFSPVYIDSRPMKITASVQEWCGQAFTQLNLQDNSYHLKSYSYFESVGDIQTEIDLTYTEDELWNLIRLSPDVLPEGDIELIPSAIYARLKHVDLKPVTATISKEVHSDTSHVFRVEYKDGSRSFEIVYHKDFPHFIQSWKERYRSGWGEGANFLETSAVARKRIMLDYWNRNNPADSTWRSILGLD